MKYRRVFIIMVVIYPLASWGLDLILMETDHWLHYILGGIIVGIITVIILLFLNKIKKRMH